MFNKFKKAKGIDVYAIVDGSIKAMDEVEDPMFAQNLIGHGVAIEPLDNIITSPINGTLSVVFPTGHAFGITSDDGLEFLIHIGVDTVRLKGAGFDVFVKQGQTVKVGDPLVQVDWQVIKDGGCSTDTMMLVTSSMDVCRITKRMEDNRIVKGKQSILFHCEKL